MAKDVTTYQSKVGRIQGGDEFYMKEGGTFQLEDGSDFEFGSTTLDARELELQFLDLFTVTQHASADISSGSVLSPAYGVHVFSAATGMSKASVTLPTASKGATLYLDGAYLVTDGNISVLTDSTVGLIVNVRGSDLSSFELSAANYVKMICATDGTWSVIEENNFTEHASS